MALDIASHGMILEQDEVGAIVGLRMFVTNPVTKQMKLGKRILQRVPDEPKLETGDDEGVDL